MAGRTGLTEAERTARTQKKIDRMKKRENKALSGTTFKYLAPHEYPSPNAFKRQINAYFMLRESDHGPQTIPGLALFLGFKTNVLREYDPGPQYEPYRRLVEYALQRIESYTASFFFTSPKSTKGVEFLMQNTAGWANKSDVNSKATMELTERKKLEQMSDDELNRRAASLLPHLELIIGGKGKTG